MPSTNGHGPKRAILYTRVSGDKQRDYGYSLDDQRRELRVWAVKEGYEILEEIEDGAWSGGFFERPGLDRACGTSWPPVAWMSWLRSLGIVWRAGYTPDC